MVFKSIGEINFIELIGREVLKIKTSEYFYDIIDFLLVNGIEKKTNS